MSKELFILDDNSDHHFLMYKILKDLDKPYRFKFFEDGKVLYHHLESLSLRRDYKHFPGLILLDLNMPQMNGMQFLKLVRQATTDSHKLLSKIPIVIMSNDIREEKIRQCYQSGADGYIVKPMRYDQTKEVLTGICRFWLDGKVV
jgi:CheY-like chemotaxis protein